MSAALGTPTPEGDEPRTLDELKAGVEEIRAQLHWVRDYL
jgi:hypothetical protein